MTKTIAIIPARGGSKRLPGKNIMLIGGIPLIAHSILYAQQFDCIDEVYISTDDNAIKQIAIEYGAKVIDRPASLSGDQEPTVTALKHVVETINEPVENVILLQATNPLRPLKLLNNAFSIFQEKKCDSLFTVSRNEHKLGKIHENTFIPFNYAIGQRSQDLEPLYFENGLLYITKVESILNNKIITENAYPLVVNHTFAGIDIDTQEDFEYAEYLLNTYKKMNNPYIEIAGRKIGQDFPPLVIAEIGINHEGSLQAAKEMVDAAKRAGVEMVKHQTHIVEDEMSGAAKKVIPGNASVSIYDIMERCALNEADELALKEYVESKGMIFISTPFSRAAAERLKKFDIPAYKIGSGECNNYPLLEHIAQFGKPVILSTGMNTIESVKKAVAIFDKYKVPVALLHTTNLYPTPIHLVRFGAMLELHHAFPNKVFGLSDHTLNNNACLGAVALGGSILERHFTDHMQRTGPDIVCSMDENACKELISSSAEMALMRGGKKEPAKEEQVTIDFAFATVCTIKAIAKGDTFTKDNIWVKRPGTGEILADKFDDILGKTASKAIDNDEQLTWEGIE